MFGFRLIYQNISLTRFNDQGHSHEIYGKNSTIVNKYEVMYRLSIRIFAFSINFTQVNINIMQM